MPSRPWRYIYPIIPLVWVSFLAGTQVQAYRSTYVLRHNKTEAFGCMILKRTEISELEAESEHPWNYECGVGMPWRMKVPVILSFPAAPFAYLLSEGLYRLGITNQVATFYPLLFVLCFAQWYGLGLLVEKSRRHKSSSPNHAP
jgi:hypothetical protein